VALKAIVGKNRPDVTLKVYGPGGLSVEGRSRHQAEKHDRSVRHQHPALPNPSAYKYILE
jgi:hypothetical protein